ncbi:MAG: membrane protein insertase YidC, partial [Brachymonas sp.]|nr:membrane protein insertase YidC [Brachymonas sp.]
MNNDFRRIALSAAFFFSLIMIWNEWLIYNGKKPLISFRPQPAASAVAPQASAAATASLPAASGVAAVPAAGVASGAAVVDAQGVPTVATAGEKVRVKTDVLDLTFDTLGGSIVGAELPAFKAHAKSDQPFKLMDMSMDLRYTAQTGLIGGNYPNHLTPMALTTPERELPAGKDEMQVRFESAPVGGVKLVKTYTLKRGSYGIGVQHEVVNTGDKPAPVQLYNQLVRDNSKSPGAQQFYTPYTGAAFYSEESKYQKVGFDKIAKGKADFIKQANDGYAAIVQQYFATAWVPEAGQARENFVRQQQDGLFAAGQIFNLGEIAPGASKAVKTTLFAGPQLDKAMGPVSPTLEAVKDYGMLTIIARPLYWLLTQLHALLGNWGWAIVALVVLLKIAFFWFNQKAYTSMAKMKNLAPKLEVAKERFKDDPQKLQEETMRIYREEKVNPFGGCLPMVIQMPVFFALYSAL